MNGNLDARGVQQRYALFILGLVLGCVGAALVLSGRLPSTWLALLFVPFMLSALGYLQAREKTCVALAGQGLRVDESGEMVRVCEAADRQALRERAVRVAAKAAGLALLLTAIVRILAP